MNLEPNRIAEYVMMFCVLFFTTVMLLIYLRHRKVLGDTKRTRFEPTISVVIPAYNEEKAIEETVRSVLDADYPKGKMEVIVVNDGSTDRTAKIVGSIKDKRVRLLNKKNEGNAAYSKNYGIKRSKGEIIITLDADSTITKDSIKKMLHYFKDDVAAVTSAVKVKEDERVTFWEKLQKLEYLFTIFNRRLFAMINGVYVTPGPFSAFRREVFDEVGLFDPTNFMEDQEIALRIQAANYRIESCMDAVVYTRVPKDFRSFMKQRERWNRGGMRNAVKYAFTINPKYGDFGLFVMLYSILSIVLLIVVSVVVATAISEGNMFFLENPLWYIEPIHVLSVMVFGITLAWIVVALKELNEMKIKKRYILIYTILYCYLITLFVFIAIFKELRGERQTW